MIYSESYIQPMEIDAEASATSSVGTLIRVYGTATFGNPEAQQSEFGSDTAAAPGIALGDCTRAYTLYLSWCLSAMTKGNEVQ